MQRSQELPQISRGREPRAAKEACRGFASRPGAQALPCLASESHGRQSDVASRWKWCFRHAFHIKPCRVAGQIFNRPCMRSLLIASRQSLLRPARGARSKPDKQKDDGNRAARATEDWMLRLCFQELYRCRFQQIKGTASERRACRPQRFVSSRCLC